LRKFDKHWQVAQNIETRLCHTLFLSISATVT